MGKLNDKAVQAAQPGDKQKKKSDGDGLALIVKPNGTKLWWLRYRFEGKEKTLALGVYPVVSLKQAREWSFEARRLLAGGVDPIEVRKAAAIAAAPDELEQEEVPRGETIQGISKEWFQKFGGQWAAGHSSKIIRRLERDLFPHLGGAEVAAVTPAMLLGAVRRVEARGALETAHRLLQNCGQIWRYAVATGRAERDITSDLRGALPPARGKHLAAITDATEIGALLRNIEGYTGSEVVRIAMRLAPLVAVRPGELRQARWEEVVGDTWTIPAGRMKAKRPHVVPLSRQALEILGELRKISGGGEYLFPSPRSGRCLSDNAILSALRRMGYSTGEMTGHGFRAMASTNLENMGFDSRLIEIQLAHVDRDAVRAAYKRETHLLKLPERRAMMQAWADRLDELRA